MSTNGERVQRVLPTYLVMLPLRWEDLKSRLIPTVTRLSQQMDDVKLEGRNAISDVIVAKSPGKGAVPGYASVLNHNEFFLSCCVPATYRTPYTLVRPLWKVSPAINMCPMLAG